MLIKCIYHPPFGYQLISQLNGQKPKLGPMPKVFYAVHFFYLFNSLKFLEKYFLVLSLKLGRLAASCFFYHTEKERHAKHTDILTARQLVGTIKCRYNQISVNC